MNTNLKNVSFQVPSKIDVSDQELNRKSQESFLCNMYIEDKLSEKEICEFLNLTRRDFNKLLEKYHTPRLHTDQDAEDEINFSNT